MSNMCSRPDLELAKYSTRAFNMDSVPDPKICSDAELQRRKAVNRARDHINYFHPGQQFGSFTAAKTFYHLNDQILLDSVLGLDVPKAQKGHDNLCNRWRERQIEYRASDDVARHLFVLRWSSKWVNLGVLPSWVDQAETGLAHNYETPAVKRLLKNDVFGAPLNTTNVIIRVTVPHLLCLTRIKYLLQQLNDLQAMVRNSGKNWIVEIDCKNAELAQCVSAAQGEWVLLRNEKMQDTRLYVAAVDEKKFWLLAKQSKNNPVPEDSPLLHLPRNGMMFRLRFCSGETVASIKVTGAIDALTAMPDVFLQKEENPPTGLPLIKADQIKRLEKGSGFRNQLDCTQQRAVINILKNQIPLTPFSLLGAPGTGKSKVLDELVWQFNQHHMEDIPLDALVYLATPTNLGVSVWYERLVSMGINKKHVRVVVAERESCKSSQLQDSACLVNELVLDESVQFIIATPMALARIATYPRLYWRSPLAVVVDEAASVSFADVAAVCTTGGEPVRIVLAGDPMQLKPRFESKVAAKALDPLTVFDLLSLSTFYLEEHTDEGMKPAKALFGTRLNTNYRAQSGLVKITSNLFYNGEMVPGNDRRDEEHRFLKDMINSAHFLTEQLVDPLVWVHHVGCAERDPATHSLRNVTEAKVVLELATKVLDTSNMSVVVLTPYTEQKKVLRHLFKNAQRDCGVKTVDEVQGQEADVVIVSLTRGDMKSEEACAPPREAGLEDVLSSKLPDKAERKTELGFLQNKNRINVIISRATLLVFLVGDQDFFKRSEDDTWLKVICNSQRIEYSTFDDVNEF